MSGVAFLLRQCNSTARAKSKGRLTADQRNRQTNLVQHPHHLKSSTKNLCFKVVHKYIRIYLYALVAKS